MSGGGISAELICFTNDFQYGFDPWMTPNICDWYGVACGEDSHVVALCLVNNNLNGSLVGLDLPYLEWLVLVNSPLLTGTLSLLSATSLPSITYMCVRLNTQSMCTHRPPARSGLAFTNIGGTLPPSWSAMRNLQDLCVTHTYTHVSLTRIL